jgi:hypothetical protein
MEKIEEFVDRRQQTWCIHCARPLSDLETNEDHVPTKSLLSKPRPHHLPVVRICKQCNTSFSMDEQYAITFLGCVLAGSCDPAAQSNASAARALENSPKLHALIEQSRTEREAQDGKQRVVWQPDVERINRVVLKNARGHAYFEWGEPMLESPAHVWAMPLEGMSSDQRAEFEGIGAARGLAPWPEVGSRMMTRLLTGQDMANQWIIVQPGSYRYSVEDIGGLRVRSVWWEYLATEALWES